MSITILQGDIVTAQVDAIVNAANPIMLGGGGVDGAIHRAAGPKLLEECLKVREVDGVRCPFGEARITSAGNLTCNYVIHTAGPIYKNETNPQAVLSQSYTNCLTLALEHNCSSIAFPAISCGVYGYPANEAADIAIGICSQQIYSRLDIYFYLHDIEMYNIWLSAYKQISSNL